jgi:hypothetical protein
MSAGDPNFDRYMSWKINRDMRSERFQSNKPYLQMFAVIFTGIAVHRYWNRIVPVVKNFRVK